MLPTTPNTQQSLKGKNNQTWDFQGQTIEIEKIFQAECLMKPKQIEAANMQTAHTEDMLVKISHNNITLHLYNVVNGLKKDLDLAISTQNTKFDHKILFESFEKLHTKILKNMKDKIKEYDKYIETQKPMVDQFQSKLYTFRSKLTKFDNYEKEQEEYNRQQQQYEIKKNNHQNKGKKNKEEIERHQQVVSNHELELIEHEKQANQHKLDLLYNMELLSTSWDSFQSTRAQTADISALIKRSEELKQRGLELKNRKIVLDQLKLKYDNYSEALIKITFMLDQARSELLQDHSKLIKQQAELMQRGTLMKGYDQLQKQIYQYITNMQKDALFNNDQFIQLTNNYIQSIYNFCINDIAKTLFNNKHLNEIIEQNPKIDIYKIFICKSLDFI